MVYPPKKQSSLANTEYSASIQVADRDTVCYINNLIKLSNIILLLTMAKSTLPNQISPGSHHKYISAIEVGGKHVNSFFKAKITVIGILGDF